MNSKAIKRQLLAAIAMVLVAAMALGSSTYAWFASNNKVEAKGMNITAVTEGANLEVSLSSTFTAGTISVTSTDTAALKPTHYVTSADMTSPYNVNMKGIAAGNWAHAFSREYAQKAGPDTYKNAEAVTAIPGDLPTTFETAATKSSEYALVVPVFLRLNPQSKITMTDIKATAEITHAGDGVATGMTTAGRVAFITSTSAAETGSGKNAVLDSKGYKDGETTTSAVVPNITTAGDAGAQFVYCVIYFDGDDNTCTSALFDTDKYTVNLTFEGTEGTAIT